MESVITHLQTIADLEARHDDLLRRLEELDARVERVLGDCVAVRQSSPGEAETAAVTRENADSSPATVVSSQAGQPTPTPVPGVHRPAGPDGPTC